MNTTKLIKQFKQALKTGDTDFIRVIGRYLATLGYTRTSIDKIDAENE